MWTVLLACKGGGFGGGGTAPGVLEPVPIEEARTASAAVSSGGTILPGDFDGDGVHELLVVEYPYLVSRSSADLEELRRWDDFATYFPDVGDVDGDGHVDVVGTAIWHGPLDEQPAQTTINGCTINAFAAGSDLDGDGLDDPACFHEKTAIRVHYGPVIAPASTVDLTFSNTDPIADLGLATLGDTNGDGLEEIALTYRHENHVEGTLSVLEQPLPTVVEDVETSIRAELLIESWVTSPGDVDGDGRGDVAISVNNSSTAVGSLYVFVNPTGALDVDDATTELLAPGDTPLQLLAAGNLDGDNRSELLIASGTQSFVTSALETGSIEQVTRTSYEFGGGSVLSGALWVEQSPTLGVLHSAQDGEQWVSVAPTFL